MPLQLKSINGQTTGFKLTNKNNSGGFSNRVISRNPVNLEVLVIGGGGAGGTGFGTLGIQPGGGGGAGGYIFSSSYALPLLSSFNVIVGEGGQTEASSGSYSSFYALTAFGGGGGGMRNSSGNDGASGGGGGGGGSSISYPPGGSGIVGQGKNGGIGGPGGGGGGGGGAGTKGSDGSASANVGGTGGTGLQCGITGTTIYYAGGGAGSLGTTIGGTGGGGNSSGANRDGTDNLGGGGGGNNKLNVPGKGGRGVVIIAYPTSYGLLSNISESLTYVYSSLSRPGYHVYTFTSGSGAISW